MYFSDVYCDRRVPAYLVKDPVLYGECLSGALYWNDFLTISKRVGFADPRAVSSGLITVDNEELEKKLSGLKFYSVTYRLWKLDGLETACEDYGHSVIYNGTIAGEEEGMMLDGHHYFETGESVRVCGNTYKMLNETRFVKHFEFTGNFDTHLGIFEGCGESMPFTESTTSSSCC